MFHIDPDWSICFYFQVMEESSIKDSCFLYAACLDRQNRMNDLLAKKKPKLFENSLNADQSSKADTNGVDLDVKPVRVSHNFPNAIRSVASVLGSSHSLALKRQSAEDFSIDNDQSTTQTISVLAIEGFTLSFFWSNVREWFPEVSLNDIQIVYQCLTQCTAAKFIDQVCFKLCISIVFSGYSFFVFCFMSSFQVDFVCTTSALFSWRLCPTFLANVALAQLFRAVLMQKGQEKRRAQSAHALVQAALQRTQQTTTASTLKKPSLRRGAAVNIQLEMVSDAFSNPIVTDVSQHVSTGQACEDNILETPAITNVAPVSSAYSATSLF